MSTDEKLYCPICNELIEDNQDVIEHDGKVYHNVCFFENFTMCDYCNEYHPNNEINWLDTYNQWVCDDCLSEHFYKCERCDDYIREDDVYWGADEQPYCNDCFDEYFYRCENCDEVLCRDDVCWDEDGNYGYCPDCYERLFGSEVIYSYHDFDDYVPRYLNDEDRNEHYNELYGIELEITGSKSTAETLQDIMGSSVVLMKDGSVDGYEMVSMPMSRKYIYEKFIPILDKGLKYLRDNNMRGHNGGGIHIHFKQLEPLGVANFINMLDSDNDKEIFRLISQRTESSMRNWCNIYQEFRYTPDYIYEHEYLTLGHGMDNHSMPLNYDTRTSTHELRIFNSNLRLERVIKNYEFMFALEDYLNKQYDIKATTLGLLQFIADNCEKYPTLNNFLWEKEIYNKAMEFYGELFVSPYNLTSTTEV